jgi:hypothetical protein
MPSLLTVAVVVPTAVVVVALFLVLWRQRASSHDARVAVTSGAVLAMWAMAAIVLARDGAFEQAPGNTVPPVGVALAVALLAMPLCLGISPTLRRLLSRQASLIRLHLWRFEGIVFLVVMAQGRVPPLWALPAGIGDILVAATAPWVSRNLESRQGRRHAIIWNLLGMVDLVVAIGLGIATNPGPAHVFDTVPSSVMLTRFPLVLVPTFLVPLAFTLHVVSLWQLLGGRWAHPVAERRSAPRTSARPFARVAVVRSAFVRERERRP